MRDYRRVSEESFFYSICGAQAHFLSISATVETFIYTVHNDNEGLAFLTELACKGQQGECYAEIQKAIKYCERNPAEENCINYLTCDCLMAILSVIETTFLGLKLYEDILGRIEVAGTACRCNDLNSHASQWAYGPSCAFYDKIMKEGDFLAADDITIGDICEANAGKTCTVENVAGIVDRSVEYNCTLTFVDDPLFHNLHEFNSDFKSITDFACDNNDCYSTLRTCQEGDNDSCVETLSCDCVRDFLSFIEYLSPNSRQDFLKLESSTIDRMSHIVDKCACDELNADAAALQREGYCALHDSIVREKYVFAGNSTDVRSTCNERHACVGSVTETLTRIGDGGCQFKQETDYLAKFLYNVNNNSDFDEMTRFVCDGSDESMKPLDANTAVSGCYEEVKAAVETCKSSSMDDCAASASSRCLDAFISMVGRLSNDSRDDFLGIGSALLDTIDPNKEQPRNLTLPNNETKSSNQSDVVSNNETQPEIASQPSGTGAAFFDASMTVIITSWTLSVFFFG
mmetsp:Transcript_14781/g.35578  ORF Transcript_14781/g.35578 Transcript_14781/m.35578 type:complete len:516 (-) Transcript_14781:616-2163(-)